MRETDRLTPDQEEFLTKLRDASQRTGCTGWRLYLTELRPTKPGTTEIIRDVRWETSFYRALEDMGYIKVETLPPSPLGYDSEKLELTILAKTLEYGQRGLGPAKRTKTNQTAIGWWKDEAVEAFRDSFLSAMYGTHLFAREDSGYYRFHKTEKGDAVWLVQKAPPTESEVLFVEERDKLSGHVRPDTILLSEIVSIDTDWFEDGELTRIKKAVANAGGRFAQKVNRAFVQVLIAAISRSEAVSVENSGLDTALATAADKLSQRGYTANRLLFAKECLHRLRQAGTVVSDGQVESANYAGSTRTGLCAFWSGDLSGDVSLVFDSSACIALVRDLRFEHLDRDERPFTAGLGGWMYFNSIVKDTRALVKLKGFKEALEAISTGSNMARGSILKAAQSQVFVDPARIEELRAISCRQFDLTKLIRLCEEINVCYDKKCYLAVAMLLRAILDHVPPIFGFSKFSEVGNNYTGARSFKESMQHLENSSRKIADSHLHSQVRSKESLPTRVQVNFASDLDVLLAEIARILK